MKEQKDKIIIPTKGSRQERKVALQESVNQYLEAIETQIGDLKKVGKNALVIGGVVVAAYALTELLLPAPKRRNENAIFESKDREDDDESESLIWSALKGAATTLLLTLAREKLVDLIDHFTSEDAPTNS